MHTYRSKHLLDYQLPYVFKGYPEKKFSHWSNISPITSPVLRRIKDLRDYS